MAQRKPPALGTQDVIGGTDGDDLLNGTPGADRISGGDGYDTINGLAGNDVLRGELGDDVLDGGEGADRMMGGRGYDRYFVDNVGDIIEESTEDQHDEVYSTISYRLHANVESLYLLGSANLNGIGTGVDNTIEGNAGSNDLRGLGGDDYMVGGLGIDRLEGGAGDDYLGGRDGSGGDTLIGGGGNDIYSIDQGDVIIEEGGGRDGVALSFDYTLTEGDVIEDIYISAQPWNGGPHLTATGNSGVNALHGGGGVTLRGEGGNDYLESYGGEGDDFLYGGAGNDELVAFSDWSWAWMHGGAGNDSYEVVGLNVGATRVVELAGEGIDTVYSYFDVMQLPDNVENIVLLEDWFEDGGDVIGRGNDLNNRITVEENNVYYHTFYGEGGNDYIRGQQFSDHYTGGSGADQFQIVQGKADYSRQQTIHDFTHGVDEILLDNTLFRNIGTEGALNASRFYSGTAAHDASDRIIFDATTGSLYYDQDGTGSRAQLLFLKLGADSAGGVDASDFVVV